MSSTGRNGIEFGPLPDSTEINLTTSNVFAKKKFNWDKTDAKTLRDEFLRGIYTLDFRFLRYTITIISIPCAVR